MSISKIQARFVKNLAKATLNFFKTAPVFMKSNFSPTTKKLTPLLIAAYNGNLDFFRQVKERTKNLNHSPTQADISPIHLAAYRGHIEISRHLQ